MARILLLLLALTPLLSAGPVTYTFTGIADGQSYTLAATLSGFAVPGTDYPMTLANIVVDPFGPGGSTQALTQSASSDAPSFSYNFGFLTTNGFKFWDGPAFGFSSNNVSAGSEDIQLTANTFGTFNGNDMTVTIANAVPEPATVSLAELALAAGVAVRRRKRRTLAV